MELRVPILKKTVQVCDGAKPSVVWKTLRPQDLGAARAAPPIYPSSRPRSLK